MIVETVSNQLAWSPEQGREQQVWAEGEKEGGGVGRGGEPQPLPPDHKLCYPFPLPVLVPC